MSKLILLSRFTSYVPFMLAGTSILGVLSGCGSSSGGGDLATQIAAPLISCSSLQGKTFENVNVVAAAQIAATGAIPSYCKVSGTEAGTQHDIELRMPDAWAHRLVQEGGANYDGKIPGIGTNGRAGVQLPVNVALSSGAVQVANNGGHRDPSGQDFLNNPIIVEQYAHTAIITANRFAKAATAAYYGQKPRFTYYEGCSNGGRGALNAAAKYGTEFNGVIAGAPSRNLAGQIEQWTRASGLILPSPTKLREVAVAAVAKCDALDGVTDGIVSNSAVCTFNPTIDVPPKVGLTPEEASAVKTLMTDLKLSDGTTIYSGYGVGDMSVYSPLYSFLGVGHMRSIVLNDPTWSPASFDVNTYYPTISNIIDTMYQFNASVTGLTQFMNDGKKIMIWHGSDDTLLSHKDTIRTWKQVTDAAGDVITEANSRLYIPASVNHCGGGPGADSFDLLTPMIAWVEQNRVPDTPVAKKVDPATGATLFTRPLCVNPEYAKYRGTGDINSVASYVCSTN